MIKTLEQYIEVIRTLPVKKSYTKEDLLIPELCIQEQDPISLYYCTHNEYMNPNAKIFIIGITPGFNQMNRSIVAARQGLEENIPLKDLPYLCKKEARFEGSLRKNLIAMLNELKVHEKFRLEDAAQLFSTRDDLLHTTSLIPYATFVKGKNYTGHQPPLMKNEYLMKWVEEHFYPQVEQLREALFIPLGKSVEEVLVKCIEEGKLTPEQCLLGFPHPSGANAHRYEQFAQNKDQLLNKLFNYKF